MKQIFILLGIILLFLFSCNAQNNNTENLKLKDIKFETIFGGTDSDTTKVFCLLGTGFFKAPRFNNTDSLISNWLEKHPKAIIFPVTSSKSISIDKSESSIIYCWIIDQNDTLNNYLIREGCFPGGTMIRPKTWREMGKWEKKFFKETGEKVDIKVLVDDKVYDNFIEQIKALRVLQPKTS